MKLKKVFIQETHSHGKKCIKFKNIFQSFAFEDFFIFIWVECRKILGSNPIRHNFFGIFREVQLPHKPHVAL